MILLVVLLNLVYAIDYTLEPMNFEPGASRNMTVTVLSPGDIINVTYPSDRFTLISGTPDGLSSVQFVLESPNNASKGDIFYFNISINGTYFDRFTAFSMPDNEIVDNKWELGHGNFNYPVCQYLPEGENLIFPIIRVWGVGTDLLDEAATNINFTCQFPKIFPRTVDSKYSTDYSDPNYLIATGELESWEGASMFRVFVLSQEIDYNIGDTYEVTCGDVTYDFLHHTVQAQIPPINITIVDPEPFTITTTETSEFIIYQITHNGGYEVRDLEFLWQQDNNQIYRQELDVMYPGDSVLFRVWANGNPTIDLTIRQKPCWMFNSRDPTYYEQTHSDSFTINANATILFSVEEAIYYKQEDFINIEEDIQDLLFLFKINQEQYYMSVSELPASQQNEANFTCYRLALRSNGINPLPTIKLLTNATSEDQIIVKDEEFNTKEFSFDFDTDRFGVVTWESDLGLCTEDVATGYFVCPTTYNYMCIGEGVSFQKEAPKQAKADCVLCTEKVEEIGAIISPTYPVVGFAFIVLIIVAIFYLYYYYEDEIGLKRWIQGTKQKREREKFLKWREQQRQDRYGGGLL